MDHQKNMTVGKPLSLLFAFALPLMFGNLFQQLYTVVDVAIVGRGVGMDALAALGTVDWLGWMLLGIAQGFSQGFAIRVSQKYGEGDVWGLQTVLGQSARLTVYLAVIATVFAQGGLPLFLALLRVPRDLYPMAMTYMRILMAGMPVAMLYNYCSAMLRAVGDSRTPLLAMTAASLFNIVGDLVAVFLLRLGIAGAAWATVLAQCLSAGVCLVKLCRTPALRFQRQHTLPNKPVARGLLRLGTPITLKIFVIALGGMLIQSVVNGFDLGFIAGYTASNKLFGLLEIACMSYGFAITTYVGQNYGAGLTQRIHEGIRSGLVLSVATAVVIGGLMLLFGREITGIFLASESPELLERAGQAAYLYLAAMSLCLPMLYILYVYQSALQGVGNTVATMHSGLLELGIRLTGAAIVGYLGYANGIFIAEVAAWFGAAGFLCIRFYHYMNHHEKEQHL